MNSTTVSTESSSKLEEYTIMSPQQTTQANGLVEKTNSSTINALKALAINKEDWLNCLDFIAMLSHGAQHASTGKSPYKMTFGCQITLLGQLQNRWLQSTEEEKDTPFPSLEVINRSGQEVHPQLSCCKYIQGPGLSDYQLWTITQRNNTIGVW